MVERGIGRTSADVARDQRVDDAQRVNPQTADAFVRALRDSAERLRDPVIGERDGGGSAAGDVDREAAPQDELPLASAHIAGGSMESFALGLSDVMETSGAGLDAEAARAPDGSVSSGQHVSPATQGSGDASELVHGATATAEDGALSAERTAADLTLMAELEAEAEEAGANDGAVSKPDATGANVDANHDERAAGQVGEASRVANDTGLSALDAEADSAIDAALSNDELAQSRGQAGGVGAGEGLAELNARSRGDAGAVAVPAASPGQASDSADAGSVQIGTATLPGGTPVAVEAGGTVVVGSTTRAVDSASLAALFARLRQGPVPASGRWQIRVENGAAGLETLEVSLSDEGAWNVRVGYAPSHGGGRGDQAALLREALVSRGHVIEQLDVADKAPEWLQSRRESS